MPGLAGLTDRLKQNSDLTFEEAGNAAVALAATEETAEAKEAFLVALAEKGETAEEVAGFAQAFRGLARDPEVAEWSHRGIDVCGTGGDKIGTFNISTTVTFVLAAGGVPVLKHGNRSITSGCGSADLLGAIGVPPDADNDLLKRSLEELNCAFFFAPAFHPAFKEIMPVRQALAERGLRTIFNILGPLINPAKPAYQLLGVFSPQWMPVIAEALDSMAMKNGFVVHCDLDDGRGMDELSTAGTNRVTGFGLSQGREDVWTPADLGLEKAPLEELLAGDLDECFALFERVLDNAGPPGLMDSIALNAGAGFYITGKTDSLVKGIGMARELFSSGAVKGLVERTRRFYGK